MRSGIRGGIGRYEESEEGGEEAEPDGWDRFSASRIEGERASPCPVSRREHPPLLAESAVLGHSPGHLSLPLLQVDRTSSSLLRP